MAHFIKSPLTPILMAGLVTFAAPTVTTAETDIGVTSAVNLASTLERNAKRRTLVVGEDIKFKDKVITSKDGLTQVLFVDGSTFTVGSNSQVVIDEFVYNPADGSGSLVSEVTRGALRFVGGKLSKNDDPVEFKTPVGILGVRGGISEIDLDPECDSTPCPAMVASLLFGDELTLIEKGGKKRRIYQPGYAFVVYKDGTATKIVPIKSLRQSRLKERLSGDPRQKGGATDIPTDQDVVNSGLPRRNSDLSPLYLRPRPEVVTTAVAPNPDTPGIGNTLTEIRNTFSELAQSDFESEFVGGGGNGGDDGGNGDDDDPVLSGETLTGVYGTPTEYTTDNGVATVADPRRANIVVPLSEETVTVTLLESSPGNPVALEIGDLRFDYPLAEGETTISPTFSQEFQRSVEGGTVLRGPAGFALYYLSLGAEQNENTNVETTQNTSFFVIVGSPTPRETFYPEGPAERAAEVRTYTLGTDYARQDQGIVSNVPLLNPEAALTFGNDFLTSAAETPFFVVEKTDLTPAARTLYAAINIEGQGASQRSMIVSDSGLVYAFDGINGEDALGFGGTRRGSYRYASTEQSMFMRGGTGSTEIENPEVFTALHGDDAEVFVYTSGLGNGGLIRNSFSGDREFIDVSLADPLKTPTNGAQYSSMMVPGILSNKDLVENLDRNLTFQLGYAAGMNETSDNTVIPFRSLTYAEVIMVFDPSSASFGGILATSDVTESDPTVAGFAYTFGFDVTEEFPGQSGGRSTYLDDDRYAANSAGPPNSQGGDTTFLFADDGPTISHQPTTSEVPGDPGTYIVSSGLAPQPQLFSGAGVTECQCDFMKWGWWGTQTEFLDESLPGGRRADFVHLGTWVTGDIPNVSELPTVGSGSFQGHAIGNVARATEGGTAQYVAVGDMSMTYDFGERTGTLSIDNFDNRSFSGTMTGSPVDNRFDGALSGSGLTGGAAGSFARGPSGPAQGVLGSFNVGSSGYSATGTFMGSQ